MSVLHLYDKLLQTPLFLGMSKDDLNQIVEHTKFGFLKFEQGKTIIREGEKCEHVYYLTNGCIVISKSSDDHSYTISEEIHAPYMFQLECLFGLTQQSSYNINSITACNMISIDKDELMKLSDISEVHPKSCISKGIRCFCESHKQQQSYEWISHSSYNQCTAPTRTRLFLYQTQWSS